MSNEQMEHMRRSFAEQLREQGLLARDGMSIYGMPVWRSVPAGPGAPQALMDASSKQRDLVAVAHTVPGVGESRCAGWIEDVFHWALGIDIGGDATALYGAYCNKTCYAELRVGMIIAVPSAPYGNMGKGYGHVGLYVGDNQVMDQADGRVRTSPLELWLSVYGIAAQPRWGWLGSIALDV